MRPPADDALAYQKPALLEKAVELADYAKTMSVSDIASCMQLSAPMAKKTKLLIDAWSNHQSGSRPVIDAFLGDIYSGLQVQSFTAADRTYANDHLVILSGLYGALRALDSVHPYRLEMGYKLTKPHENLYDFWGTAIADSLPTSSTIVNLSAVEYTKAVLPYIKNTPVIAPKFMTVSPKTGQPTFVTVHAKIARGAFANWLIKNRINDAADLITFNELGYRYSREESQPGQPAFICSTFGGLGLSVRLQT